MKFGIFFLGLHFQIKFLFFFTKNLLITFDQVLFYLFYRLEYNATMCQSLLKDFLKYHQPRLDAWDKCSNLVHWEDPEG